MDIIRILYTSRCTRPFSEPEIEELARASAERNLAAGISGILVYSGGRFLQVLEGEADAVESLFARIERDDRHTDVVAIYKEPIEERLFGEWSMRLCNLDEKGGLEPKALLAARDFFASVQGLSHNPLTRWIVEYFASRKNSWAA